MKLGFVALAASLTASSALACIPLTWDDGTTFFVSVGGLVAEYPHAALRKGSDVLRAEQLRAEVQALMDDRFVRESIQIDDANRFNDPGSNVQFWSDANGNPVDSILEATHVTSRCVLVDEMIWDGFGFSGTFIRVR